MLQWLPGSSDKGFPSQWDKYRVAYAHSQKTFKAHRDFKKHAAEDVLKGSNKTKPLSEATDLEVRPLEIDWPLGELTDEQMSHGVVCSKHWLEFRAERAAVRVIV